MTRGLGWPSSVEIDLLWRAAVSTGAVGHGSGGLLDGSPRTDLEIGAKY